MNISNCCIYLFLFFVSVECITEWDVFGQRNAYNWAVDTGSIVKKNDQDMTVDFGGKTCTAIFVEGITRHGSRYPKAADMEDITKLQEKIITHKVANDSYNFIATWVNDYPQDREYELVETGRQELADIGGRYAQRFHSLFKNHIDKIKFVTSSKSRTIESAKKFYEMFTFQLTGEIQKNLSSSINDTLIRFYDDCDYIDKAVDGNVTLFKEFHDFMVSATFKEMVSGLETRLGFEEAAFTTDELELLYEMCAFEKYIYNRDDWCSFLTDTDRKIMEYRQDIQTYYERSYGNNINAPLACTMLENMFTEMDEAKASYENSEMETYARGSFKFGHFGSITRLYTALELFKDDSPLLATNMAAMANRKFKGSHIFPMAGNLAFVLYACQSEGNVTANDYAVKLFVNERDIVIPRCGQKICAYEQVKESYRTKYQPCDKKALCYYKDITAGAASLHCQVFMIILTIFFPCYIRVGSII